MGKYGDLKPFFHPGSIAHFGASEEGLYSSEIFLSLREWKGALYPINPGRKKVFDIPCYFSLDMIPETPDLALITLPRDKVVDVVRLCGDRGVKAAVIISAGFAEQDSRGKELQEQIKIHAKDMRIIGPNCAGLLSLWDGPSLTRLFCRPEKGGVSFVSGSGALMMALFGSFSRRGIGLRYAASIGNQADVTLEEVVSFYLEDAHTSVIAAFVEGIGSRETFVSVLRKAAEKGVPVILVKSGKSELGKKIAATHSAALASSGRVFEQICRQYGALTAQSPEGMMDLIVAAQRGAEISGSRIGVLSQSGGMAGLTADIISECPYLALPGISKGLSEKLRCITGFPGQTALLNPLDAGGDLMRGEDICRLISCFAGNGDFDAILLVFAKNPDRKIEESTALGIVKAASEIKLPLAVIWVGGGTEGGLFPKSFEIIIKAGIPLYTDPAPAVAALSALRERDIILNPRSKKMPFCGDGAVKSSVMQKDNSPEKNGRGILSWKDTERICMDWNLPLVRTIRAKTREDAAKIAEELRVPVALKGISPRFTHKSEKGLVRLGLRGGPETAAACDSMSGSAGEEIECFLVQEMAASGVEMTAGIIKDSLFGPLVLFGPGGVLVELFNDVRILCPPFDTEDVITALKGMRCFPLLKGYRGSSPADIKSFSDLIVLLGKKAGALPENLEEMDLNPVIVHARGCSVVDVRVKQKEKSGNG